MVIEQRLTPKVYGYFKSNIPTQIYTYGNGYYRTWWQDTETFYYWTKLWAAQYFPIRCSDMISFNTQILGKYHLRFEKIFRWNSQIMLSSFTAILPICLVLLPGIFNFCLNLRKLTSRSSKTWYFGLWLYTKERYVRSTFRRLGGLNRRKLSKRDDVTSTTWRECSDWAVSVSLSHFSDWLDSVTWAC